jgi:chromosome partitioning protein
MKTVAFVSQKGGSGKTTLAIHLASEAALAGDKVLLIDLDPQGSATLWARQRGDRPPDVTAGHLATLKEEIESAKAGGYGLVAIDTAPHADQAALQAARVADLVLVPCRPATFDLGAIGSTLDLCQLAKRPALVVLNAAPIRSRVVDEAMAAMTGQGANASAVVIHQRVAFQHCLIDGRTAGEFEPGGAAADEVTSLLTDVKTRLHAHNGGA